VRRVPNMSPAERNIAIGMLNAGCTASEVANTYGHAESLYDASTQKQPQRAQHKTKPRSGRPQILSRHARKLVYRAVRKNPKITYAEHAEIAHVHLPDGIPLKPPSRSTLYRIIKKTGLLQVRCKKRPKLTPQRARARLLFARECRGYPWHRRILKFSDECSIQKGSGHTTEWCFR
jgi:hypothetical protein